MTISERANETHVATSGLSSRRILVVDDHEETAELLGELLLLKGYDPVVALSGRDGLEAAARMRPGVVLVDMTLPDIHGYEVCRRIRAQAWGQDILIIGVSGWDRCACGPEAIEAGCDHYFVKPIRFDSLETLLRRD